MKRGLRWSADMSSSGDSSNDDTDTDTDTEDNKGETTKSSKLKTSQGDPIKKKKKGIDFEALSQHGYRGGLSVLKVPPPKEPENEQNWSWSSGKETRSKEEEESFKERQNTRYKLADGEQLAHVITPKEKRNLSFQQKEKRKRDIGQTSRGKNYVEEEKRLLRDNGVYSGFDS